MGKLSEADLQKAVMSMLIKREVQFGDLVAVHVPNEGKRSARAGRELKRQGLRTGAPDVVVFLHENHRPLTTISIELKFGSNTPSKEQLDFGRKLSGIGHPYFVVKDDTPAGAVSQVEALLPNSTPSMSVFENSTPSWLALPEDQD